MRPERPIVVVLTGPSSAGKTSLAREIQRRSELPFVHLEADRIHPSIPERVRQALIRDHDADTLVLGLHRSMAAWSAAGLNILVDGSLPYGRNELRSRCLDIFAGFDLRIVTVHCDTDVLTQREQGRTDRPAGWAAQQALDIHDGLVGDAHVDTSEDSPVQAALSVLDQLRLAVAAGSVERRARD